MKVIYFIFLFVITFSVSSINANEVICNYSENSIVWFGESNNILYCLTASLFFQAWDLNNGELISATIIPSKEFITTHYPESIRCILSDPHVHKLLIYKMDSTEAIEYDLKELKITRKLKSTDGYYDYFGAGFIEDDIYIPTKKIVCISTV